MHQNVPKHVFQPFVRRRCSGTELICLDIKLETQITGCASKTGCIDYLLLNSKPVCHMPLLRNATFISYTNIKAVIWHSLLIVCLQHRVSSGLRKKKKTLSYVQTKWKAGLAEKNYCPRLLGWGRLVSFNPGLSWKSWKVPVAVFPLCILCKWRGKLYIFPRTRH